MVERIEQQPTVRERYAARLVADGVLDRRGRRSARRRGDRDAARRTRAAPGLDRRASRRRRTEPVPTRGHRRRGRDGRRRRPAARAQRAAARGARRVHGQPEARAAARAAARGDRRGRDRLGAGRGARLRLAARGRDPDPALRAGHRARDVLAPAPRAPRPRRRARPTRRSSTCRARNASFEVYNSPLSEYAALGFEYGYSVAAPDALVLWEAQFGDFVNGAQIVIDQFIVAGRSKWGQTSRLTLLLPHGYEGNGPEHSSARLERFLQLGAQDNIRVANCTTAAQFFHLLRRQALDAVARPLVVMTPKGLLRLKQASSTLEELSDGAFQPVIDDPRSDHDDGRAARALLGEGLLRHRRARAPARRATGVAVARVEQLYPFPVEAVAALLARYPRLREVVWAQEEPQNMGPWRSIRHRLEEAVRARSAESLQYVGRTVEGEPERGLPDRPPARAGPHRADGPRGRRPRHAATLRRGPRTSTNASTESRWQSIRAFPRTPSRRMRARRTTRPRSPARSRSTSISSSATPAWTARCRSTGTRSRIRSRTTRSSSRRSRPASRRRSRASPRPSRPSRSRGRARTRPVEGAALDDGLWGRSRDFDWGE